MPELIKITEYENGKRLVSARELHEFLEVGRDFTTWIKGRIKRYNFIENIDYITIWSDQTLGSASNNITDYALTVDTARSLSLLENNKKGHQVRRYFIKYEMEKNNIEKELCIQNYILELKSIIKREEKCTIR